MVAQGAHAHDVHVGLARRQKKQSKGQKERKGSLAQPQPPIPLPLPRLPPRPPASSSRSWRPHLFSPSLTISPTTGELLPSSSPQINQQGRILPPFVHLDLVTGRRCRPHTCLCSTTNPRPRAPLPPPPAPRCTVSSARTPAPPPHPFFFPKYGSGRRARCHRRAWWELARRPPGGPLLGQDLLLEQDGEHDPASPAHAAAPSAVAPPSPFSGSEGSAASRATRCASPVAGLLPVPLVADDEHAPMRSCSPTEGMDQGCGIQPASPSHITLPNAVVLSNNFRIDGLSLAVAEQVMKTLMSKILNFICCQENVNLPWTWFSLHGSNCPTARRQP